MPFNFWILFSSFYIQNIPMWLIKLLKINLSRLSWWIRFKVFFFIIFFLREINPLIQNGIMKIVPKNRFEEKT